jgi:hypothetical protein
MRAASLALFALATSACAGDKPASSPRTPTVVSAPPSASENSTAPPPPREPTEAVCDADGMPPRDIIGANIANTELTALGEITSAKITATDGSEPPPTSGYVHFVYEVDIVQQFTGERLEHLRLIQGAEAGIKTREPGTLFFFSACMGENGEGFEPDVGFFFPVEPGCQKQIAELAARETKSLPGPEDRGSACHEE